MRIFTLFCFSQSNLRLHVVELDHQLFWSEQLVLPFAHLICIGLLGDFDDGGEHLSEEYPPLGCAVECPHKFRKMAYYLSLLGIQLVKAI